MVDILSGKFWAVQPDIIYGKGFSLQIDAPFLSLEPRLCKRVCPSIGWSFGRSIGWSSCLSITLLLGGQKRGGKQLILCIQTGFFT